MERVEFSIRAHTEIVITSPKNKGENSLPSSILDAVNQGDFIVGIHFKVCKAARILEGKTFGYRCLSVRQDSSPSP